MTKNDAFIIGIWVGGVFTFLSVFYLLGGS
jgi:hypothetical protein